jgi:hypothetical protein
MTVYSREKTNNDYTLLQNENKGRKGDSSTSYEQTD